MTLLLGALFMHIFKNQTQVSIIRLRFHFGLGFQMKV